MLDLNTNFGTYMKKLINDIFPTIIRSKIFDLFPNAFSISAFNSMNSSKTSDFFLMKKAHVYLEKLSIKVRTYQDPFNYVMGIGPLISE